MDSSNPLGVKLEPRNHVLFKYPTDMLCPAPLASLDIVSELEPHFRHWSMTKSAIIEAPTGSGKSTFVLNSLIPYALEQGRKVLLLSHRVGICSQQKHLYLETHCPKQNGYYTELGLRNKSDFDSVCIMTYQELAMKINNPEFPFYDYVVFDECHYFASDALFSDTSDRLLWKISKVFQKSVRIYMTATIDSVLPLICATEKRWKAPIGFYYTPIPFSQMPHLIWHYKAPASKYKVKMHYFKKLDEIVEKIKSDASSDKWLVFVSSKDEGCRCADALSKSNITTTYLDAHHKGSTEWDNLITDSKFSSKVLFCTSVLDCGINIIDDELTHVVLTTPLKDSFLQMLGRNRKKNSYHVYVKMLEESDVRRLHKPINQLLNSIRELKSCKTSTDKTNFLRQLIQDSNSDECQIYWLDEQRFPLVKESAEYILNYYHEWYDSLEKSINANGPYAFAAEVCSWLGLDPPEQEDMDISLSKDFSKSEIIRILDSHLDKPIAETSNQDELSSKLRPLLAALVGKESQSKRCLGALALTRRLKSADIPYSITKKGCIWSIEKSC